MDIIKISNIKHRNLIAKDLHLNGLYRCKVVPNKKKMINNKSDWKKEMLKELDNRTS